MVKFSTSRLYQAAKLFLFAPSSGMYSCPLAMTDGAANITQVCTLLLFVLSLFIYQFVYSRLYQGVKLYLMSPSCGLSWCPMAMTDGAAKILKVCVRF